MQIERTTNKVQLFISYNLAHFQKTRIKKKTERDNTERDNQTLPLANMKTHFTK